MDREKFIERLNVLINANFSTFKNFIKEVDINFVTMKGYVDGVYEPKMDTIIKMADAFDVSTDYLLGRTDEKTNPFVGKKAEGKYQFDFIQNAYPKISEKARKRIHGMMEVLDNEK